MWMMNWETWRGRAKAEAVSRWLPTAETRVWFQVISNLWWTKWHCSRLSLSTQFFLTIIIPLNTPYSSIIRGCTTCQLMADIPSGLSLTPTQEIYKKKNLLEGLKKTMRCLHLQHPALLLIAAPLKCETAVLTSLGQRSVSDTELRIAHSSRGLS
jgi:hypothetical protein